ncbi:amino acid adenylation [Nostoc sp. NIES-4103]|nr:amino acid adenylation [Nostoc sp. NIES-4103]
MGNQFSCIIIGEGTLPIQCAEILRDKGHDIYGVVSVDNSVHTWAESNKIPHIQPSDNLREFLSQQPFDYLLSIVNPSVLPEEILELPRQCAINYHDAPLPRYAGVNATSWALMNQEKTHGVTWHVMAVTVDAGDILKQVIIDIADDETALTLNGKCYEAALNAFNQLVDELCFGTAVATKPNLNERTYFSRSKRPSAGGIISWKRSAHELDAMIRALDFGTYPNPLGKAKLVINNNFFIVSQLEVLENLSKRAPGTIITIEPNLIQVSTASYDIALHQVLTINGQVLSIADLVEKFGLQVGYQFCDIEPDQVRQIEKLDKSIPKYENFWVKRLASLELLALPYAQRTTLHLDKQQYAYAKMSLPHEAIAFLQERYPQWNWGDFLETAFVAYLARIGSQGYFDIGYKHIDLQQQLVGTAGLFASVVPHRVEVDCEQSFEQVFQAYHKQVKLTRKNLTYAQDVVSRYPALRSLPQLGSKQLFPVVIERVEKLEDHQGESGNELSFIIAADGKECCWLYNTELLDGDKITRMQEQFAVFVQGIVNQPEEPVAYLPLLSQEERYKIWVEWNDTQVNYPPDKCIHQLFEEQVEKTPDAVAVVFENTQLTYQQLNQRANQLAHHLRSLGVGPEALVGICLERSLEMIVGLLAILKAGGAYVPLDPTYPSERLAFVLQDTQTSLILTTAQLVNSLPTHAAQVVCLDSQWQAIAHNSQENLVCEATPDNLMYIIYTSGSTGQPKGVMIPHRGIYNQLQWRQTTFKLTQQDKVLQTISFSFDPSVWQIFWPLCNGAQLILARPGGHQDPAYLVKVIVEQQITVIALVPSILSVLLEQHLIENCQTLKHITCGGEALSVKLIEQFFAKLNLHNVLLNCYGPTEASIDATFWKCQHSTNYLIAPIGRPIANTQTYILDSHLQPVPIGVPGELYIGGVGLGRGYLNRPELTQERFIVNPFHRREDQSLNVERLYKTGDLARYLSNGDIEFLGRLDNQVKIRGFRIELGEVEAAIAQHPSVQQTVVLAREDNPGDKRLVAYIIPHPEQTPSSDELRGFLQEKLALHMVPSAFVFLNNLPLNPNGKIDTRALPAPSFSRPDLQQAFVAPRTPTEQQIADIWVSVLKLEKVGIHDDFFVLGGHSLLATQIMSRLHQAFGVDLPLRTLFEVPTVAKLAHRIETVQWANQLLPASFDEMTDDYEEGRL